MPVNQKYIADMLGIHRATVSKALKGSPNISEELRNKILDLCNKLEYRPNYNAKSLISKETKVISILQSITTIEVLDRWVHSLQSEIRSMDYKCRLDAVQDFNAIWSEGSADAFVVFGSPNITNQAILGHFYKGKVPICFTDCEPNALPHSVVAIDNAMGSKMLVDHLMDNGHTNIGFFGHVENSGVSCQRYNGYVKALNERKMPAQDDLCIITPDYPLDSTDVYQHAERIRSLLRRGVTAIIASSDLGAAGILNLARIWGLSVPEDLAVAGFDNSLISRVMYPQITSIDQNVEVASKVAIEHIIASLERPNSFANQLIEPKLVIRQSTDHNLSSLPPPLMGNIRL